MNNQKDYIIILDNGHGVNTPGKQSPDGKLKEYKYTREVVQTIYNKLTNLGYKSTILVPEETDISLSERVKRANKIYNDNSKKAILISVHCNAAGNGSQWLNAQGWSVFISQNASQNSKKLANYLANSANDYKLKLRIQSPGQLYWTQSLAICRDTNCPAVLTENLFQDNKQDVDFLLSNAGKETIANLHVDGIIKYLNN